MLSCMLMLCSTVMLMLSCNAHANVMLDCKASGIQLPKGANKHIVGRWYKTMPMHALVLSMHSNCWSQPFDKQTAIIYTCSNSKFGHSQAGKTHLAFVLDNLITMFTLCRYTCGT